MVSSAPSLSPADDRALLNAIFTGSDSLSDLADSFNITLIDLLELIASPDFQARLVALEQAAAHALRARASRHLDAVLDTLTTTLQSHRHDYSLLEPRTDPEAVTTRRHERIHMRHAANTILRLTRYSPLAPNAILCARPAAPRGGAFQPPRNSAPLSRPPGEAPPPPAPESASCPPPSSIAQSRPAPIIAPTATQHTNPLTSSPLHLLTSSHPTSKIPHPTSPRPASSLLRRAGAAPGPAP